MNQHGVRLILHPVFLPIPERRLAAKKKRRF
jgi:hypothetical protein